MAKDKSPETKDESSETADADERVEIPEAESRLITAKRALLAPAEPLLPTSQIEAHMSATDRWIYFDGPEPERIRPFLDALRELQREKEDKERMTRRIMEKIDAVTAQRLESRVATAAPVAQAEDKSRVDDDGAKGPWSLN